MKKFFSFVAAALVSTAMFAEAPANVPSDAVLNGYKAEGANVVVGFYTTAEVCNDIVFVGSYNNWSANAADCAVFEAVEGYDNWYVVSVNDPSADIQGKPVQLKSDGSFSWDYQVGDDVELYRGTMTIEPGYSGEVNLKLYGTDAPVVYGSAKWKQDKTPCVTVPTHDYHIVIYYPVCMSVTQEALIGDFDGWSGTALNMDMDPMGNIFGEITIHDEEGHGFKPYTFDGGWDNELVTYDANEDAWKAFPNFILGEQENITLDFTAPGAYGEAITWECVAWTDCTEDADCTSTGVENVEAAKNIEKVIENGALVIYVDGVRYNAIGARF